MLITHSEGVDEHAVYKVHCQIVYTKEFWQYWLILALPELLVMSQKSWSVCQNNGSARNLHNRKASEDISFD